MIPPALFQHLVWCQDLRPDTVKPNRTTILVSVRSKLLTSENGPWRTAGYLKKEEQSFPLVLSGNPDGAFWTPDRDVRE